MSLGDRSFVELLIRHLLTASSWKRRVLFPGVALPRTTGRRQEAFHSATKVRWMTTLSYWDTREETALEGIKTGKVGCSHVHLYVHFPFSCPSLLPSFSIIPRSFFCVCISPLRCVFFPPCLYFLVVTLKTLTTQKQTLQIFSDISWAYHCMIWACFWKPGNSFFQVRLNLRFIGCSDNGAARSDHGWINCSPQPIGRSDEFLTSPKLWSPQLEQSWRIDSLRSVPFFSHLHLKVPWRHDVPCQGGSSIYQDWYDQDKESNLGLTRVWGCMCARERNKEWYEPCKWDPGITDQFYIVINEDGCFISYFTCTVCEALAWHHRLFTRTVRVGIKQHF